MKIVNSVVVLSAILTTLPALLIAQGEVSGGKENLKPVSTPEKLCPSNVSILPQTLLINLKTRLENSSNNSEKIQAIDEALECNDPYLSEVLRKARNDIDNAISYIRQEIMNLS